MRVTATAIAVLALAGEAFARGPARGQKAPRANKVVAKSNAHKHVKRQVVNDFPPKTNASFEAGPRYTIMDNDWGMC